MVGVLTAPRVLQLGIYTQEGHLIGTQPLLVVSAWRVARSPNLGHNQLALVHPDGRVAIVSCERRADEKRWLHLSISRRDRLPSWEDLVTSRDEILGPHRKAIQVLPPRSEYVNLHDFCLHLWACLDGDGLPDFRAGEGDI